MGKRARYVPILIAMLGIITSCSKDLSRGRAEDLITANQDFTQPHAATIVVGNLWWDARSIDSIDTPDIKALDQNGVLTFRKSGRSQWIYIETFIDLTPLGKELSKSWTVKQKDFHSNGVPCNGTTNFCVPSSHADVYTVDVARRHFKRVTGIRLDPGGTKATADFEFGWLATDAGKAAFKGPIVGPDRTGHAAFELYDDGWRLTQIQLR